MATPKDIVPVLQKETSPLVAKAKSLTIENQKDMIVATELLSILNKQNDRVVEEREKITKPLNQALKVERARWKPVETFLQLAIDEIRTKMSVYQTEAKGAAEAQAQAIASRIKPGTGNLSMDTALAKIEAIETPEKETATIEGLVQFRTTKMFEVVDLSKLPLEYHVANEAMIRASMKQGKELPGVRYYEEEVPVNYR